VSQSVAQVAQDEQEKRDVFPFVGIGTVVVRVGSDKWGDSRSQLGPSLIMPDSDVGRQPGGKTLCIGQWGILSLLIDT
jgi:hypothetical protein